MKENNKKTANQHYIPRFYQKLWECEKKGFLWELDKSHRNNADNGIRKQAIRFRNSQEYLYEADESNPTNIVEKWYGKFENLYSERYKCLISSLGCMCKISARHKLMICKMFANLSARHPKNVYNNAQNNALASHFTLGEPNKRIDRKYIQNLLAFSQGGMYEVFGGGESECLGEFEQKLLSLNIQLLVSDKPNIVFCNSIIEQISYHDEYYFPICPTVLALFSRESKTADGIIRKITLEEYRRFIRLYIDSKEVEQIYANNKLSLEKILLS